MKRWKVRNRTVCVPWNSWNRVLVCLPGPLPNVPLTEIKMAVHTFPGCLLYIPSKANCLALTSMDLALPLAHCVASGNDLNS